uniref:Uncharacterized protein n=1 Tax=Glossina austeni TaxID=7395 RepID=A0A1A9VP04_GLOAU
MSGNDIESFDAHHLLAFACVLFKETRFEIQGKPCGNPVSVTSYVSNTPATAAAAAAAATAAAPAAAAAAAYRKIKPFAHTVQPAQQILAASLLVSRFEHLSLSIE